MKFDVDEVKQMKNQIEKENKHYLTPKEVIRLLDWIGVLERQNADLLNQLGSMIHNVEHYKWWCDHICNLYEKQKKEWKSKFKPG